MLLPLLGNPIKYHEEILYLQPMIPPKRFDIFPPDWGMLRRSRRVQIFREKLVLLPDLVSLSFFARGHPVLYTYCTLLSTAKVAAAIPAVGKFFHRRFSRWDTGTLPTLSSGGCERRCSPCATRENSSERKLRGIQLQSPNSCLWYNT